MIRICPHCQFSPCNDTKDDFNRNEGDFYTLDKNILVRYKGLRKQTTKLMACPKCKKVFISD